MENSISHGIVAFLVPLAWAIIIYPACRRYHLPWVKTLLIILGVSFVTMLIKELFDAYISVNDIVADILGLFFGTAFLSAIFIWGGKGVSKLAVGRFQITGNVSLRDFLIVVLRMEERAIAFFDEASRRLADERSKDICKDLSQQEQKSADEVRDVLAQWLSKPPNEEFASALEDKMNSQELYVRPILSSAHPRDVLEYAIEMKAIVQDLYAEFIRYFPLDWKREKLKELLELHTRQDEKLHEMLSNVISAR